jgi:hypothetical protein
MEITMLLNNNVKYDGHTAIKVWTVEILLQLSAKKQTTKQTSLKNAPI